MNIYLSENSLATSSIFKIVFMGYLLGAGLIFGLPMIAISLLVAIVGKEPNQSAFWLAVPMVPIVLIMQSLVFASIISVGLWVFRRFSKIIVVA